ncbi:Clan CE, family C48, Ulp1-like cysteine peptidase [Trichomonas vaginalis G3]|uniref:Clan CE, family C48, Ulp1-like cysteine peptidase n=1 Tax=Trichomonas vaginalis (strain ATCC PRA-98 / G3) TaxID=412133 RepID=A2E8F2_TRIV3|nr:protein desumoylation [Trichomonas vaginalis G3]EAY11080.1 Clan CE, family C48, Ulp1-like cysteine peptidase [Trichomonas vaginalis G3]KAI5520483.1 protein desumoylation [Trichomonas vaginalis G3]|eukprot:XP_001323303.1 Clan CE, family C48, Ulp1-like cysteine peptidase [Trichomonas vaginalis G3]
MIPPESFYSNKIYTRVPKRTAPVKLEVSKPAYYEKTEKNAKIRIQLKVNDLDCLQKHEWLTDIVIDAYLKYLINNSSYPIGATNTYFGKFLDKENYTRMKTWEGIPNLLEGKYNYFLIPYATRAHWILLVVCWQDHIIRVYDSLNRPLPRCIKYLSFFLQENTKFTWQGQRIKVSRQQNSSDCGVFLLKFAECIVTGQDPLQVNQDIVSTSRLEIRNILIDAINQYVLN